MDEDDFNKIIQVLIIPFANISITNRYSPMPLYLPPSVIHESANGQIHVVDDSQPGYVVTVEKKYIGIHVIDTLHIVKQIWTQTIINRLAYVLSELSNIR
jgi:hypothetical protein